jgi:hypothetical protein
VLNLHRCKASHVGFVQFILKLFMTNFVSSTFSHDLLHRRFSTRSRLHDLCGRGWPTGFLSQSFLLEFCFKLSLLVSFLLSQFLLYFLLLRDSNVLYVEVHVDHILDLVEESIFLQVSKPLLFAFGIFKSEPLIFVHLALAALRLILPYSSALNLVFDVDGSVEAVHGRVL